MSDARESYDHGVELAQKTLQRTSAVMRVSAAKIGNVIAEGDSWFDYPFQDVLEAIEDQHGYEVESVAHRGDNLEDMAYSDEQLERLVKAFEKVADRLGPGKAPTAILLSGGGNDIAGDEFAMLLDHVNSGRPPVNQTIADGVIQGRLRAALASLIGTVQHVSQQSFGHEVRVIVHGYAYPVPDGRGFWGGAWFLPGPWLEPGFRRKGYAQLPANTQVMKDLIDAFNVMLDGLVSDLVAAGKDVRYVDLRPFLSNGADYKKDWANELHPTGDAFKRVAAQIAAAIP